MGHTKPLWRFENDYKKKKKTNKTTTSLAWLIIDAAGFMHVLQPTIRGEQKKKMSKGRDNRKVTKFFNFQM